MELEGQIYALITLFSSVGLIWLFYGPWQQYCVDRARNDLFAIRDRLFTLALEGKLSFESDEYKLIRSSIEKLIRYSHEISLWRILAYLYLYRRTLPKNHPSSIKLAFQRAETAENNDDLKLIKLCVSSVVMRLITKRSITLFSIYLFIFVFNLVRVVRHWLQPYVALAVATIIDRATYDDKYLEEHYNRSQGTAPS